MASWTAPTTYATGNTLSVTAWNAIANNETFLYQAPYASYYNSVTTSIAGTDTQVTLGGTKFSGYGFSLSSNNIVPPLVGMYWVGCGVEGSAGGTGFLQSRIYQAASLVLSGNVTYGTSGEVLESQTQGLLQIGSIVDIGVFANQSTGSTFDTITGSASTYVNVFFVGSQ